MRHRRYKLAVLVSHPIQYQVPLFQSLARHPAIDLRVFFCSSKGLELYRDPGFGVSFSWDVDLLRGYSSTVLKNVSPCPNRSSAIGFVNPGIVPLLVRGGYDAVWIHGWAVLTNWIAWASAVACRVPVLLRGEANGLNEPTGLKGVVKRTVLKAFFNQVSCYLAIGTNNANFYRSYGIPDEHIFLTPYSVDNEFFMKRAGELDGQKRLLREKEGLSPDLPVILFCGKFQEKKRPIDLLKAFAHLHDHPAASLVFVGDGPLRSVMERFVAERHLGHVHILGFKNQQELPACYAMADLLVLPSSVEPWGLVVNEAMCCGLPVIVSDKVGAAADLIRQGINGFIYPAGNLEALAECMKRILANEEARCEMGRQSRGIISRWRIEEDLEGVVKALEYVTSL